MHVIDRRDTFDLDQQYVFDDEVGAIGAVDGLVLVENGNRYLAFDRHATENELPKEASLVRRFEESRPQRPVDFNCAADGLCGDLVRSDQHDPDDGKRHARLGLMKAAKSRWSMARTSMAGPPHVAETSTADRSRDFHHVGHVEHVGIWGESLPYAAFGSSGDRSKDLHHVEEIGHVGVSLKIKGIVPARTSKESYVPYLFYVV